jgi:ABC-type branched-subunit amino acid transport system ATPase component
MTPLLRVRGVTKRFGGLVAVRDVSFDLNEGEILFVIGPNGAGKTTLFNVITGFLRPDEGEVFLQGRSLNKIAPHEATRLGIGRTFQVVQPLGSLTVLENAMLGAFLHGRGVLRARDRAFDCLQFLGLEDQADKPASTISLGARKLLEVARALATGPKLILLDEVMAGLNPVEAATVRAKLERLHERGVLAIGGIEHIMRVVMALATRVVVLDHGKKLVEGVPAEVMRNPAVIEAYLGSKFRDRHGESQSSGRAAP